MNEEEKSTFMMETMRAIGFSKTEVNVRRLKWNYLCFTDNLFQIYDEDLLETVHTGSAADGMTGGPYFSGEPSDFDSMLVLKRVQLLSDDESVDVLYTREDMKTDFSKDDIMKFQIRVQAEADREFPGYYKLKVVQTYVDPEVFINKDGHYYLQNYLGRLEKTIYDFANRSGLIQEDNYPLKRSFKTSLRSPHGPASTSKGSETGQSLQHIRQMVGRKDKQIEKYIEFEMDNVDAVLYRGWPEEANCWISRVRPSGWPNRRTIEKIRNSPCYLAPAGHFDSHDREIQWRLSFNNAEQILVEEFSEVQIATYALLKIILKDYIKTKDKDTVLSSYIMKTIVYWCSEKYEDDFKDTNFFPFTVFCLKMLRKCITNRHLPNYFIENRNMLNSKFTSEAATSMIKDLDIFINDITEVVVLLSFQKIFTRSSEDRSVLQMAKCQSIALGWLEARLGILERLFFVGNNNSLWQNYVPYRPKENLNRFTLLLKYAEKFPGNLWLFKRLLKHCMGMLSYSVYLRGSRACPGYLQMAKELLEQTEEVDCSGFPLKTSTFYYAEGELDHAVEICDRVLNRGAQVKHRGRYVDYLYEIMKILINQIIKTDDQEVLDRLMVDIEKDISGFEDFTIFYSRNKSEFEMSLLNAPSIVCEEMCFDVIFMAAEIEMLPLPLQFEIVSNGIFTSLPIEQTLGLRIHPTLYALFLKFMCCYKQRDQSSCRKIISTMTVLQLQIEEYYHVLFHNLMASCFSILAEKEAAAFHIMESLKIDPTTNNVSFWYLSAAIKNFITLFHQFNQDAVN